MWALVKGISEEHYAVRRTLDTYACRMFSARQEKGESVASWGSRIVEMQYHALYKNYPMCSILVRVAGNHLFPSPDSRGGHV